MSRFGDRWLERSGRAIHLGTAQIRRDDRQKREKRNRTEELPERHRDQNRHGGGIEQRPHHESEGQQREDASRAKNTGVLAGPQCVSPWARPLDAGVAPCPVEWRDTSSSDADFQKGWAKPWHPALAQLTRPLRTSSSADLWSGCFCQRSSFVEWHCIQFSLR